jgi:hypothetical protein
MNVLWTLIVFAHVGPMGDGNSNALTTVPGFATEQGCKAAGNAAKALANGTLKKIEFACVPMK